MEEEKISVWKKIFSINSLMILFMLGAVVWVVFFIPEREYYSDSKCSKDGCREGYKCLQSLSDNICVTEQFYKQYWTISNFYEYDPCRLVVRGDHTGSDLNVNFFIATLKECDWLKYSCTNPDRYNTDCSWDEANMECVCNAKPYTGEKNITKQ
jgi:hypothetical protein